MHLSKLMELKGRRLHSLHSKLYLNTKIFKNLVHPRTEIKEYRDQ